MSSETDKPDGQKACLAKCAKRFRSYRQALDKWVATRERLQAGVDRLKSSLRSTEMTAMKAIPVESVTNYESTEKQLEALKTSLRCLGQIRGPKARRRAGRGSRINDACAALDASLSSLAKLCEADADWRQSWDRLVELLTSQVRRVFGSWPEHRRRQTLDDECQEAWEHLSATAREDADWFEQFICGAVTKAEKGSDAALVVWFVRAMFYYGKKARKRPRVTTESLESIDASALQDKSIVGSENAAWARRRFFLHVTAASEIYTEDALNTSGSLADIDRRPTDPVSRAEEVFVAFIARVIGKVQLRVLAGWLGVPRGTLSSSLCRFMQRVDARVAQEAA